jgi:hypothetical protein
LKKILLLKLKAQSLKPKTLFKKEYFKYQNCLARLKGLLKKHLYTKVLGFRL